MDPVSFADRYRVEITFTGDGKCTCRVTDLATWQFRELAGLESVTEQIAHQLATSLYPELLESPPYPARISGVETYRDGGSRGLFYRSIVGQDFEFHLKVQHRNDGWQTGYSAPILFYRSVNTGRVAFNFSWQEAEDFLTSLMHDADVDQSGILSVVQQRGQMPAAGS